MLRCVITNDDGVDAPGLQALHAAMDGLAEVVVVAPATEWSGSGHAAPAREAIRVERRDHPALGVVFVVHGSPADCARLALADLVRPRPDILIAGINHGGNVGVDVYYSGTVAAAREASIMGCPAIAISQLVRRELPEDWAVTTARARCILDRMLNSLVPTDSAMLWNVNIPHLPPGAAPRGVVQAPLATTPVDLRYERLDEDPQQIRYQYLGRYSNREKPEGTDVAFLFDDWITLTPLALDVTRTCASPGRMEWSV